MMKRYNMSIEGEKIVISEIVLNELPRMIAEFHYFSWFKWLLKVCKPFLNSQGLAKLLNFCLGGFDKKLRSFRREMKDNKGRMSSSSALGSNLVDN